MNKLSTSSIVRLSSLSLLCLALAGCASHKVVTPLAGGFVEVSHTPRFAGSDAETRVSLEFQTTDGKTRLIWPDLYGVREVVHGDVAIFVGDKAYVSADADDRRGVKPRLFVVRTNGLPLDITGEILWRWAKPAGKDFAKAGQNFSTVIPTEANNGLQLKLVFDTDDRDWPDSATLQLSWDEVAAIMQAAQSHGTARKDPRWHTPFIQ